MTQPLVSVVVPNWNGIKFIGECLKSLAAQTYQPLEIIVVENGSVDNSAEFIEAHYPHVRLLKQSRNLGFAGGVNVGIAAAQGEFVALFNNDAVADDHWIEELVTALQTNPKAAACTSKMLAQGEDNLIDTTGEYYYTWGLSHSRGRGEKDAGQFNEAGEVFGACGGATIYRRDRLVQVGSFDDDFFAYSEDIDLSFRLRLAGHTIIYQPTAVVHHAIGGTSGGGLTPFTRYHSVKNLWFVYLKNLPAPLFWKYLPRYLFLQILFLGNAFRLGLGWAHVHSLLTAIRLTPKMLIKRHHIQSVRKISVKQLDNLLVNKVPPGVGPTFRRVFPWLAPNQK